MRQKNMKQHVLNTGYGLFLLILACPLWACSYEEGDRYYEAGLYEKAYACFMQPENGAKIPKPGIHWASCTAMVTGLKRTKEKRSNGTVKAAVNGYAVSQYNLACQYEKGRGVERDYARAMFWYEKAAEQNDSSAEVNIGYLYSEGIGVPRDMQKALYWYRRAAAHENTDAHDQYRAHVLSGFRSQKRYKPCHAVLHHGGGEDHPRAQYLLGEAYETGRGLEKDCSRALYWYKKAADNGELLAMDRLGQIYSGGLCFQARDHEEARRWRERSFRIRRGWVWRFRPKNRKRHFPACFARRRSRIG